MLQVKNVGFSYREGHSVLKDVSFDLPQGAYQAIIGASGCGKSTLLEIIYGLIQLKNGEVIFQGEKVLGPDFRLVPGEPNMKYLPQDFDLMPYTSVAENVGTFLSNMYPEIKKQRVKELLEVVEMTDFSGTKVKFLSGGQKQRVALARVLAKEPELLLLDEPFSHIDNFRKNSLRRNLFSYLKNKGISVVVATHDITDALSFADKTLLLDNQRVLANKQPFDLYNQPESSYIASFFGDVNTVDLMDLNLAETNDERLVYPGELCVDTTSSWTLSVQQSWFRGSYYLIELIDDKRTYYLHENRPFSPGESLKIGLNITEHILKLRKVN